LPAARGRGHGEALLRWIFDEAQRLGCDEVHLDSGTVPDRWAAHRLYHRVGMNISSHHFARTP
jgi:GNAT superfamily N-acetyltransferase